MKTIACGVILLSLVLVGTASAYLINCDCETELPVGEPLVITGTSNIPPGVSFQMIFYKSRPSVRQISQQNFTIQEGGAWSVTFETTGLLAGEYNLQIADNKAYPFGSASEATVAKPKTIQIIDRSTELVITSPGVQNFDGMLDITGKGSLLGNRGVQVTVTAPSGSIIFGPTYIETDSTGAFSRQVTITESGTYRVRFADANGYITTNEFTIRGSTGPTATPTAEPAGPVVTASTTASRDAPAYFAVDTRSGTVTITTSVGIDWVVEVSDEDGAVQKVNAQGNLNPEEVRITARGGMVYVKVYPVTFSDQGTATLSVRNADSVTVSADAASYFGDIATTPTQESPLPLFLVILAAGIAAICRRQP
ncbi:MAG: hypothetical protein APR53_09290 [Methanoculleus sp. SDB]|nr:MAG: hypothetical protein APR53_09290 [Methanoculleus sp. SDB]